MTTTPAEEFEVHRPRLFSLAYRLLGSAEEAEDAVQDACLRYIGADRAGIEHPAAWLAKVVTNLCLNRLTSARARRERYVGTWLPEPVVTSDGTLGPLESAEQRDAVSMAMLVLLERLTPTWGHLPRPQGSGGGPFTCCGRRSATGTGRSPGCWT
ncbi:sigma factor [Streptomyces sp. NPDC059696]|uniref:sigma factor n=1 Tax=Streptomyces sp. NPDC059696 TaxID=3346911 RepID=UPI0036813B13